MDKVATGAHDEPDLDAFVPRRPPEHLDDPVEVPATPGRDQDGARAREGVFLRQQDREGPQVIKVPVDPLQRRG